MEITNTCGTETQRLDRDLNWPPQVLSCSVCFKQVACRFYLKIIMLVVPIKRDYSIQDPPKSNIIHTLLGVFLELLWSDLISWFLLRICILGFSYLDFASVSYRLACGKPGKLSTVGRWDRSKRMRSILAAFIAEVADEISNNGGPQLFGHLHGPIRKKLFAHIIG